MGQETHVGERDAFGEVAMGTDSNLYVKRVSTAMPGMRELAESTGYPGSP
jgi:hypothetical protein